MNKMTLRDVSFEAKRALVRVDFNVPMQDGQVTDDTRISASIPTLKHILDAGGSAMLMSHLGRPKGERVPELSLEPVAARLAELIGNPVTFAHDCIGDDVRTQVEGLQPGQILLLENLRFHAAETAKDESCSQFAKQLAGWGDVFVNDAFGSAHRPHASVSGVAEYLQPAVAGFLLEKEIEFLVNGIENAERPIVAILGGAKVSDKIGVIETLLEKADSILIGGAMAYTLMASEGHEVGTSLIEEDKLDAASETLIDAEESKKCILLVPVDHVVAEKLEENAPFEEVQDIPPDKMGLDIGPETRRIYGEAVASAKTVIWNGPMGVFEIPPFHRGTEAIARAVAESDCLSIVGGGDSVAAIKQFGLELKISHISTGGGASLELLEGKELPGLTSLTDRN